VAYRDAHGQIWDAWYDGTRWNLQRINKGASSSGACGSKAAPGYCVAEAPPAAGDPVVWVVYGSQHFTYRAEGGVLWDVSYQPPQSNGYVTGGAGVWSGQQLPLASPPTSGSNPYGAATDPVVSGFDYPSIGTAGYGIQAHICYRDANGNLWDVWTDNVWPVSWSVQRINDGTDGLGWRPGSTYPVLNPMTCGPAAVSAPSVSTYSSLEFNQQHFAYIDKSGTLQDAYYSGPPAHYQGDNADDDDLSAGQLFGDIPGNPSGAGEGLNDPPPPPSSG
jgi:hypothetical protein